MLVLETRTMWMKSVDGTKPKFLFFALMLVSASSALATVPVPYVELTRADMQSRQFEFKILKSNGGTSLNLHFPKKIRVRDAWIVPHYTRVVVKNMAGVEIASAMNWVADNEFASVVSSYDHDVSDVSVSVTYVCPKTYATGCTYTTTFGIDSVSKFIDANPDVVNLPPKCRKITSVISACSQ